MFRFLLLASVLQGALGATLLEIGKQRTDISCCANTAALMCLETSINVAALGEATLELPYGLTVNFANMIPGEVSGYHYTGDNADAILTYNKETNSLHGHIATMDGRSFVIENCGQAGHVVKEIDLSDIGMDNAVVEDYSDDPHAPIPRSVKVENRQSSQTYSVYFYYTPEFQANTPDIDGYLNQVLAETNQGYANSGVDLTITKFCAELATINDGTDFYDTFNSFKTMKGTITALRGTADTAALLTSKTVNNICGLGSLNVISSGNTVTLTAKSCAVGYYSFGHEIGHNIGLTHDPATSTNNAYAYGHGHLIAQGSYTKGLRTILAYNAENHGTRVNYYSDPNINHPLTGTPTGLSGTSDNARLLREKAVSLAAIGNESGTCAASPTGPTGSTSAPATYCGETKKIPTMLGFNTTTGVATPQDCQGLCNNDLSCEYWSWKGNRRVGRRSCRFYKSGLKYHKSFHAGPSEC